MSLCAHIVCTIRISVNGIVMYSTTTYCTIRMIEPSLFLNMVSDRCRSEIYNSNWVIILNMAARFRFKIGTSLCPLPRPTYTKNHWLNELNFESPNISQGGGVFIYVDYSQVSFSMFIYFQHILGASKALTVIPHPKFISHCMGETSKNLNEHWTNLVKGNLRQVLDLINCPSI